MKNTICLLLIVCSTFANRQANAQKLQFHSVIPDKKNEIGIEIGGNSLFYSVYYQRSLFRKNNFQFNIRLGGAIFPNFQKDYDDNKPFHVGAYIMPNVLLFHKRHAWEFGMGLNMFANFDKQGYYNKASNRNEERPENTQSFLLTPQIGYRLYFKQSRFYLRTSVLSYILVGYHQSREDNIDVKPKWLPWGAVGFGYNF